MAAQSKPFWHDEALSRATNRMVAILWESCTVQMCEDLAETHPDDWTRMAQAVLDEYETASREIARRDFRRREARRQAAGLPAVDEVLDA